MKFHLKKDKWMMFAISIPLLLGFFISIAANLQSFTNSLSIEFLITLIFYFVIMYLIYSFYQKSYYLLDEEYLIVKFGLFKLKIAYNDITNVQPIKIWWSAPALTNDRLAIYKKGRLWNYIGPLDKERFIKELSKRTNSSENI